MRIAYICLPLSSHLSATAALARKLADLGHDAFFFGIPDAEPAARDSGLPFVPFCADVYPAGSVARLWGSVRALQGLDVMRYWSETIQPPLLEATLRALPGLLTAHHIEAVVIDVAYAFAELAALEMDLPYVQVWLPLHFDATGATPPNVFSWPYLNDEDARARNLDGVRQVGEVFFQPLLKVARTYADRAGLTIDIRDNGSTASRIAVVSQTPVEFDFPGIPWSPQFHYAGPFSIERQRPPTPFAWERLTGAPLIYASLGTLVNGRIEVHRAILEAVSRLPDHQIVFSVGDEVDLADLGRIPPNTVVVTTAPQIDLLERASLCITHGGLNTVLEALAKGVPMVAIPIAYDQPGVAARIAYHRVGEFIEVGDLQGEALFQLLAKVLREPVYREAAQRFRKILAAKDGIGLAAGAIEGALQAAV